MARASSNVESFESPDVDVSSSILKDHRPIHSDRKLILESGDEECFETSSSNPKENFARLYHSQLDASRQNYDFDSIAKKQTEFEVLGGGPAQRKFESPLQRYNRLQLEVSSFLAEIDQLQAESASDPELEQGVKAAELAKEIASLQTVLTQKFSDKPQPLTPSSDSNTSAKLLASLQTFKGADEASASSSASQNGEKNGVVYELYYNNRPSDQDPIVILERKIATLEKTVGQSDPLVSFNKPLSTVIDDMERRFSLLSETKVSQLETRIKTAAELLEDSRLRIESEKESKINQLSEVVSKWDVVADQLPAIVSRLQTLRSVHESSVGAINSINTISQQQESIQPILQEAQQQLGSLQESVKANTLIIENNVKAIEERLQSIESKINRLQS